MDNTSQLRSTDSDLLDERKAMVVGLAWQMACASMTANNNQIIINAQVYNTIGRIGLEELKLRLSRMLGNTPVAALIDVSTQIIRLVPAPVIVSSDAKLEGDSTIDASSSQGSAAGMSGQHNTRTTGKKSKIPRPPNAFILYRQHHHPTVKSQNPGLHNNEISKLLGRRWKNESDTIKIKYKELSDDLKCRHAAKYPGYQYAPRKPGEKKKRKTARETRQQSSTQDDTRTQDSVITSDVSMIQGLTEECSFDEMMHESYNFNGPSSDNNLHDADSVHSSAESQNLQYHEDTITLQLPSTDQNLQSAIDEGIDYNLTTRKASDAEKQGNTAITYETQLSGLFNEAAADQMNYLEDLIDWDGLGVAMANMQEMADDLEASNAYQTTSPMNSRM